MRLRSMLCPVVLAASAACGDAIDDRGSTPPGTASVRGLDEVAARMLAHVPDDTPWVWLNAEPLPDAYVERIAPLVEASLAVWGRALEQPLGTDDPELVALAEAFRGHMSAAGLRELGFATNPHAVAYGLGLAPVVRIELHDGTKVARLLERIDAADGEIEVRTIDGHPVWAASSPRGPLTAAVAVVGDELVITAYPPAVVDELLPRAVGSVPPTRSLARSEWLRTARREHDLLPHGLGSIDLARIMAILAGEGDELTQAVTRAWATPLHQDACVSSLRSSVARAPRIFFGMREIGARRLETAAIWELDEGLRNDLRALVAPIAGLGRTSRDEGLASLAVGIDFTAAVTLFERWRHDDRLLACDVRPATGEIEAPAWLVGLHGGSAVLHEWDPQRERIGGVVVIGVDDPQTWLGLVAPTADLDALRGRPVRATDVLRVAASEWTRDAWLARGRRALGLASGEDARRRLRRAVDRERGDGHTLAAWSIDVHDLLDRLPRAVLRETLSSGSDLERAWVEAVLDRVRRTHGALAIGDHGLELGATVELAR